MGHWYVNSSINLFSLKATFLNKSNVFMLHGLTKSFSGSKFGCLMECSLDKINFKYF